MHFTALKCCRLYRFTHCTTEQAPFTLPHTSGDGEEVHIGVERPSPSECGESVFYFSNAELSLLPRALGQSLIPMDARPAGAQDCSSAAACRQTSDAHGWAHSVPGSVCKGCAKGLTIQLWTLSSISSELWFKLVGTSSGCWMESVRFSLSPPPMSQQAATDWLKRDPSSSTH